MPFYSYPIYTGNAPQHCRIENGKIVEGPRQFANGSELESLAQSGNLAELKARGWVPHYLYDPGGECFTGSTFEVLADEVAEVKQYRAYTEEEKAEIARQEAERLTQQQQGALPQT